jgi:hypothetical protein
VRKKIGMLSSGVLLPDSKVMGIATNSRGIDRTMVRKRD